jgi:hypothetical protein
LKADLSFSSEPAVWLSTGAALVEAIIVLAVSFGIPITADQHTAINGVAAVVIPITFLLGPAIRSQVTPTAKLATAQTSIPVPGGPVTAMSIDQRVDALWAQRQTIDAQLAQISAISGQPAPVVPPPAA